MSLRKKWEKKRLKIWKNGTKNYQKKERINRRKHHYFQVWLKERKWMKKGVKIAKHCVDSYEIWKKKMEKQAKKKKKDERT